MSAILGRIVMSGDTFVEEFIAQAVVSENGWTWTRDKKAAHDFGCVASAERAALKNAYNGYDGRLRLPMVLSDRLPMISRRAMRGRPTEWRKIEPAEAYAATCVRLGEHEKTESAA